MKKRILLLLVAMIGMATSAGWAQEEAAETVLTIDGTTIYANGHAITIEAGEEGFVKVSVDDTEETTTLASGAGTIYGGSKEKAVENTQITMKSGVIKNLFGGGYFQNAVNTNIAIKGGEITNILAGGGHGLHSAIDKATNKTADVTGKATVSINNATVNYLISGGRDHAKTKDVEVTVTGEKTKITYILGGGYAPVNVAGQDLTTEYEAIANGVETSNFAMTGGAINTFFVGGGYSYSYSKEVTATLTDVKIGAALLGTGSNGRSDKVVVKATGCTFEKSGDSAIEIAAVNRGKAGSVSMTFDNCTFPEAESDYFCYLGATHKWQSGSFPIPTSGKTEFVFTGESTRPVVKVSQGIQDLTLTGAVAKIDVVAQDNENNISAFTIPEDKTWTFNDGLEMTKDVTLTKTGILAVKGTYLVSTVAQLNTALSSIEVGGTILLASGEYAIESPLVVDKSITIKSADANDAAQATIKGCIAAKAEGVTISDLKFEYAWVTSEYSKKTGIAVFGNSATITGNTFTTDETGSNATNGIVFYPKDATKAANYVVTGNTFSLAKAGSTAIMVRENFKSTTQIPDVARTASLPNGSVVDANVMGGKNIFTTVNGLNYCRLTGDYSVLDATGSGSEVITHKYLYTYTDAANLVDALTYSQAKSTINLSGVAAEDMLIKLNAETKPKLTAGICIICSDMTVYTDENSAKQSTATGEIKYIKLADGTYSLVVPTTSKVTPEINVKPTASTIEAGQPLPASILTGGKAIVAESEPEVAVNGVFSWQDPSATATAGTKSYKVVFTPSDLTKYEVVKEIEVEIADVKQYYTVTIGKLENGTIQVAEGNKAGKYEDKKVLTVTATPNAHYAFSAWGKDITEEKEATSETITYTVSKNDVLTATFVAKNYAVTIDKATVTKQDGTPVSTNATLPYGTVLNVFAAPASGDGSLNTLTCNDKGVINNTVTVDGVLDIKATFNPVVASTYRISLGEGGAKNGKIQLFDVNGNAIALGSTLAKDEVVSVVAVPDPGYELAEGGVTVSGTKLESGKFTVAEADVTVSATFVAKKYAVTNASPNATITLSGTESLDAVDYGTSIKITKAEASADYKLLAVVVNGKEIAVGESFIVKGATTVNAVVQALPAVQFTDKDQTYTYNKEAQAFVVRTIPAGISGIAISYKQGDSDVKDPTNAGTYDVYATLEANSSYKSMTAAKIGTLTIEKAPYTVMGIPEVKDIKEGEGEDEYHWKSAAEGSFRTAYYKLPVDISANYHEPKFVIPATEELEGSLTKVTLDGNWAKTRSTSASVALTLNATNGSISVWNGDVQVIDGTALYAGQKLTLKGIPSDGTFSIQPTWSGEGVTTDDKGVTSITLPDAAATVTATFNEKTEAPFTKKEYTRVYNGTAFGAADAPADVPGVGSTVSGWVVSFAQDGVAVSEPTAVGEYTIMASRSADDMYKATANKEVGTLKITQAEAVISEVVGTDITTIQTLNQSVISGTANVEGTFSWVNPNAILTNGTHTNIPVLFTPTDVNYAPVTGIATVKVETSTVTVRTIELTESESENGNGVVLTLNGTDVAAGTTVKAGDKLTATFSAKAGYIASATINDASYASGTEFEVKDEAGNVKIAITYTKQSDPDPDPDPAISVISVSLDKSELTLASKDTYALKATINPTDASNQRVSWTSSDDKIATVDQEGNVTAIASGKATITVTTEDGNKTATCVVTVGAPVGIEELVANTHVYSQDRTICIEPAAPIKVMVLNMTGALVYNGLVTSFTQIPVSAAGVYAVKIGTENDTFVHKISVK